MRSLAALFILLIGCAPLHANDADYAEHLTQPIILVAKPELRDPLYGASVLMVRPLGERQHVGFIINRPTHLTLSSLFPDHEPSQKVADPVYLGGPVDSQALFVLVRDTDPPGGNSIELTPGLYAVLDGETLDKVIESEPDPRHARFVAGLVIWQPGELLHELKQGAWFVRDADPALVMRSPEGLWEELVQEERAGDASGRLFRIHHAR
jgi:putative transcriptional regulator